MQDIFFADLTYKAEIWHVTLKMGCSNIFGTFVEATFVKKILYTNYLYNIFGHKSFFDTEICWTQNYVSKKRVGTRN